MMIFKLAMKIIRVLFVSGIIISLATFSGCSRGSSDSGEIFEEIVLTSGRTWTIMYYGDADCNLESALLADIAEMKAGFVNGQNVKLIVLFDRNPSSDTSNGYSSNTTIFGEDFSDTRLYEITNGTATRIGGSTQFSEITTSSNYEANMGDADTLKKFINFCKENYPATDYALILSNHGGGPKKKSASLSSSLITSINTSISGISKSICWDESSSDDFLFTAEISDVLTSAESVQLFGLDACLMSSAEFAYQFRNDASNTGFKADFMVASAPTETGNGWQYTKILLRLNSIGGNNGEADKTLGGSELYFDPTTITPKILGGIIVEEQRDSTTGDSSQSLTCLDLSKIKAVKDAVDVMAVSLLVEKSDLETIRDGYYPVPALLHYFDESSVDEWTDYPFFDIYNLAEAVNSSARFSSVIRSNAAAVRDAVDSLVVYSFANSAFPGFLSGKSGVQIFFPDGDYQIVGGANIDGVAGNDDVNLWYWQDWYNSKTKAEIMAIFPSYTGAPYGNLSWCKDGINASTNVAGNWFELLDSWYDTQWPNDVKGGFNAFQW